MNHVRIFFRLIFVICDVSLSVSDSWIESKNVRENLFLVFSFCDEMFAVEIHKTFRSFNFNLEK